MPKDIEKTLRDMGKNDRNEYPRDLKSATRAEFTTNVRMANKKGSCCPLFASIFLLTLVGVGFGSYILYTQVIIKYFDLMFWMMGNS